jgi:hypothetical protein
MIEQEYVLSRYFVQNFFRLSVLYVLAELCVQYCISRFCFLTLSFVITDTAGVLYASVGGNEDHLQRPHAQQQASHRYVNTTALFLLFCTCRELDFPYRVQLSFTHMQFEFHFIDLTNCSFYFTIHNPRSFCCSSYSEQAGARR